MSESLVEKAKNRPASEHRKRIEITDDHIELALAWLSGEVSITQVNHAMSRNPQHPTYSIICRSLREAYQNRQLILSKIEAGE